MPLGGLFNIPNSVSAPSIEKLRVEMVKLNIDNQKTLKFFDIQPDPEGGWIAFYYNENKEEMQTLDKLQAERGLKK